MSPSPDPRGAFGGFIGPRTLRGLVENTAPWLFDRSAPPFDADPPGDPRAPFEELAEHPLGWWAVVRAAERIEPDRDPSPASWTDYFAVCVASHFASAATFVPTDVDTKIRAHLWYLPMDDAERERRLRIVLAVARWDLRAASTRWVDVPGVGVLAGHDGETLSVIGGGLVASLVAGDTVRAAAYEEALDAELRREAAAFDALAARKGGERDLLVAAAIVTHNAGDVDQGLSAREGKRVGERERTRFADLAGSDSSRYGGSYARAAALYRELLAAEGHRHYPLREIRPLRASPRLLLPIGPFLDDWGERLARWPGWSDETRAEVLAGLLTANRKVAQQLGYSRALAGWDAAAPGGLEGERIARHLPPRARKELREPELRRRLAVRRESFEASHAKRARQILAAFRG